MHDGDRDKRDEGPGDDEAATIYAETPEADDPADPDATLYGDEDELPPALQERAVLSPGSVLFGEYEIVDLLGAGGMGEVYRARHRRLNETRAIKVMHAGVAQDPTAGEFFDREAKALLSVRHPAVVHCHDLLSDEQGRVYLVMEMIDGISLADRIGHNIVLPGGRLEEAKLIDFGIAKVLAAGQETIMDGFKGKLPYASPEQLGFFEGHIDGRSDMYSLGLVLYAAATGHLLDMGATFVAAVDSRRDFAGLPTDFPEELRAEVEPLLALDPNDRPASLAGFFGGELRIAQAAAGVAETPRAGGPSLPGWALPAGAAAGVALVGLVLFLALRPDPSTVPQEAPLPSEQVAEHSEAKPTPVEKDSPVAKTEAKPTPVEPKPTQKKPAPSKPRVDPAASARTRLKIHGLLRGAAAAYDREWLTSPAGESAYDKYREVLKLDSRNKEAREGIQRIGDRYVALGREALDQGDTEAARKYLAGAQKVTPKHTGIAELRTALDAASG
jgi:serine/threonine protein kinase